MEFLGIFFLLCAALMAVITTRWIAQARRGIISVFNQNLVLFVAVIAMLFAQILRPHGPVEQIGYIILSLLVLIFLLNRIIGGSQRTQEEARIWMGWTVFWLGGTGLVALVMDQLTTKRESEGLLVNCSYCCFYTSLQLGNGKEQKSGFEFYVKAESMSGYSQSSRVSGLKICNSFVFCYTLLTSSGGITMNRTPFRSCHPPSVALTVTHKYRG